jgi:cell division protein ZapA
MSQEPIQEPIAVSVRILEKEYRVSCGPDEEEGLRESARMLDQRMREIRQTGRVIGVDRIAVMAALNIAYELIQSQNSQVGGQQDLGRRLMDLQKRLGDALAAQHQLDAQGESV